MNFKRPESDTRFSRTIINIQDRCSSNIMEARARKITAASTPLPSNPPALRVEKKKMEYRQQQQQQQQRSLSSQGSARRLLPASYFSLESLLLLICLTASLLILPLILPPLPPPPFLLLLLPIGILAVLMILAFMPTNARDLTYTHV